ncbi:Stk1 family PASTA domain-containing Ser/Thr kinase [Clostridium perfringens]|uniref:non-specific serine/threonine protein kinase n=1 Tax=Clostridium perfringens F262 TaxID=883064 RepID=A0AAV3FB57_CLOPF|nr:Stk1 family PASTA domain-containing Ser/Thr kinase [Clostridium perfringens]EIA16588.1 serine/threonine protein kinase [Clostridium perfringens F262]ELC8366011.1 Stk1 family PASTA domain-containing Ser/Thr kinase [Clostridium perfringens]ELC8394670.1 Stk1 family PASTA domain-containing Ser/Thr kinase [Clostridium perfringens]MBO3342741.1 Stk1 family PASTA domain-containing Ser/Thr kinase [Clostridium perfringens]MBO3345814.1 Stk1 family PASTA domain-containing Ser/Thr kinase [Clostridium pe
MIGKILGNRYELLQCVGEGGMSFVYKARCRKLNRFVAVKILKDEFKNNEEIVRRFKKEATAIANLSNPNVVNVLDVGTQDDINYIVMEYVEGKTLKDIIKEKGALPYEVAISIGIKVAKALECAHKSGIIHRDVKPQNILVTEEGVVKVTDFGIAKSMDSSTIAHTNSVMGSAHYFSPEQAKGTYTDYRTDLYSLGIVLYEMVTGVVPFNGDSPVTVAVKHIQEKAIPPKNINQNIPNSLNDLIMKAMEKDPVNRYQTAKEIIGDLEKIKKDPNVTISSKSAEDEDQFTRVMSPVVVPNTETNNSEPDEDDEDDDEYYEDDEDEDEDEEENNIQTKPQKAINKKKKKSPILIIITTILVVALGITLGFLGMKKFMEGGKDVKIPNVVGEKVEDAKSKLEGLGLKVLEVTEESDQEKGIVLKVDPNVDSTVKSGSEVKLTVSGGEGQIKVPNFAEMNLDSVKRTLKSLGLELGTVDEEYSDSVPRGEVISQSPNANESVDKGSKVNVTISKGKEIKNITLNIPDVSGKSVDEAKSILANAGVEANAVKGEAAKSEGEAGKVYSQSQSGHFTIKQGEKVTITINYYGDYVKPEKSVPGVTGKSVDEAKSELTNAGFKVNAVKGEAAKSADQAGKVYSQDGGSSAKEGATITITYYGEYVEPNPTPNPDPKPNPDQKPDSQTSSTTNQDHKKS